jgi:hypothetical protein
MKYKVNPTFTIAEAFRDVIPYASDKDGVFRTGEASRWLIETYGCSRGTANATVFYWSDPTSIRGYRRYRRYAARTGGDARSEPNFVNAASGTLEVEGWAHTRDHIQESPTGDATIVAPGHSPSVVTIDTRVLNSFIIGIALLMLLVVFVTAYYLG